MNVNLSILDLTVIGVYIVALLFIGLFVGIKEKITSSKDLFLGGGKLKWPAIGFSIFSTNVSPMMVVGTAGLAYSKGMVSANFEWLAWIFLMLMAMVFAPHYLNNKISTMPEFLKVRYGKNAYHFLSYYLLFSILFLWLGGALYVGGKIIAEIFSIHLAWSVIVIALLATSFTVLGGLKAIVRTDIFQSIIIIVGSIILIYMGMEKIGGFEKLYAKVPEDHWKLFLTNDDKYSWYTIILGYPVVAIFYFCTDQMIVQKTLAAKNIEEGQKGAVFTSFLKMLMPLLFIPGLLCVVLFPDIEADNAYVTMVTNLLPSGLVGLIVAAMLAALINTVAAGFNSFSTIFTLELYKRKYPHITPMQEKKVGQYVILLCSVLAVGVAITFSFLGKEVFEITQSLMGFFAPPLSAVFLLGVLWKRATPKAGEITLIGGGILCLIVCLCYNLNIPKDFDKVPFMLLSFYLFAILSAVLVVSSYLTTPAPEKALPSLKESYANMGYSSSKKIWMLWLCICVMMICLYIYFN